METRDCESFPSLSVVCQLFAYLPFTLIGEDLEEDCLPIPADNHCVEIAKKIEAAINSSGIDNKKCALVVNMDGGDEGQSGNSQLLSNHFQRYPETEFDTDSPIPMEEASLQAQFQVRISL
jgi:hypothetical protein